MRIFNLRVFEQSLEGTAVAYSDPSHDLLLGSAEQLAYQIVAENSQGTDVALLVWEQTSSDGIYWFNKETLVSSPLNHPLRIWRAYDTGTTPNLALVRLRAQLSGTTPSTLLTITVCGRGEYPRTDEPLMEVPDFPFTVKPYDAVVTGMDTVVCDNRYNEQLGLADSLGIQLSATNVSGTGPKLSMGVEFSNDGRFWDSFGLLDQVDLSSSENNIFLRDFELEAGAAFVRFYMTLAGTNPEARLKLLVTGREKRRM